MKFGNDDLAFAQPLVHSRFNLTPSNVLKTRLNNANNTTMSFLSLYPATLHSFFAPEFQPSYYFQPRFVRAPSVRQFRPTYCQLHNCGPQSLIAHRFAVPTFGILDLLDQVFERENSVLHLDGSITSSETKEDTKKETKTDQDTSKEVTKTPENKVAVAPLIEGFKPSNDGNSSELLLELPKVEPSDVSLEFDADTSSLKVKAEKKIEETKETDFGTQKSVRRYLYRRTLPIPAGIDPSQVKADFVDGKLKIAITNNALPSPAPAPALDAAPSAPSPASSAPTSTPALDAAPSAPSAIASETIVSDSISSESTTDAPQADVTLEPAVDSASHPVPTEEAASIASSSESNGDAVVTDEE